MGAEATAKELYASFTWKTINGIPAFEYFENREPTAD